MLFHRYLRKKNLLQTINVFIQQWMLIKTTMLKIMIIFQNHQNFVLTENLVIEGSRFIENDQLLYF
jgi:hypothetical protein